MNASSTSPAKRALVALERQHVVALLFDDLLGDLGLTAHRVDGDDAALDAQQRQQLRDRRDLVGLRLGGHLPEHDAVGRRPGTDEMQRRQAGGAVMRAAQRLAVDGDDLSGDHLSNRGDPATKAVLERLRLQ